MTQHILDVILLEGFLHTFINWIITNGGIYILLLIIFAETGLFIGFFLPGDSLLFAAGIVLGRLADEFIVPSIPVVIVTTIVASILGNMVGYWFGKKTGPLLYERKETWLFRRKHLIRAKEFYDQYGKATIFLAKFLPIIRTFAPILAGVIRINFAKFMLFNLVGAVLWIMSIGSVAYFLGRRYPGIEDYLGYIFVALIVLTAIPVVTTFVRERRSRKAQ